MPRDSNGTYTLPSGNPVSTGTPIISTWAVSVFNDISVALTNSLAVPGSVTPEKLSNDPAGFQAKLGIDTVFVSLENRLAALEATNSARIGVIRPFATGTAPSSFFECDGRAISRTQYATLFGKIGTTFGDGDGTTTFNIPDMRANSVRCWDQDRGVDPGRAVGSEQDAQTPTHTHGASISSNGAHAHTGSGAEANLHLHSIDDTTLGPDHYHWFTGTTASESVDHAHLISVYVSEAGGHAHTFGIVGQNASNGSKSPILVDVWNGAQVATSAAGGHAHTFAGTTGDISALHAHELHGTTNSNGAHSHTVSVDSNGDHTHSLTTASSGAHTHPVNVTSEGTVNKVRSVAMMWCIKYE